MLVLNFGASVVPHSSSDRARLLDVLVQSTRSRGTQPNADLQRISGEMDVPPAKLRMYKVDYRDTWWHPLTPDLTLQLSGELGYANG